LIESVQTGLHKRIDDQADNVDENLKLYLTVEDFTKILGELTEKMIEKQKERVEAERAKTETRLKEHAALQQKEFETKFLLNRDKLKQEIIESVKE
jgi:hypothetical protein